MSHCVLAACSTEEPATRVVVEVHSELGAVLDSIEVVVRDARDRRSGEKQRFDLDDGLELPFSFAVAPREGREEGFVLVTTGRDDEGEFLAQTKARAEFEPGKTTNVLQRLRWGCEEACDSGQSCSLRDDGGQARCSDTIPDAERASESGDREEMPGEGTCPTDACSPGGLCIASGDDYSCSCEYGYHAEGSQRCVEDKCGTRPLCGQFDCQNRDEFWTCVGQFSEWPVMDTLVDADIETPGVLIDRTTKLMWQRVLQSCGPEGRECTWPDAESFCAGLDLAGHGDWRLPTPAELLSIADTTRIDPAFDPELFPDTPGLALWSGTVYAAAPTTNVWYINAYHGEVNHTPMTRKNLTRCVRQSELPR